MIPFRKSIGFRLFAISFILLAIPLLVDSFILVKSRYEHSIGDAKSYLVEVAHLRELPVAYIKPINEAVIILIETALNLEGKFPEKDSPELNQKLKEIAEVGSFHEAFLLKHTPDKRYVVIAAGNPSFIGKDYTKFFKLYSSTSQENESGGGYEAFISYDNDTGRPFFLATQKIFSLANEPVGMIALSYDITDKLNQLLKPVTHHYKVEFALLLSSGIIFAASDPSLNFKYFIPLSPEYVRLFKKVNPLAEEAMPDRPLPVSDRIGFPFFEFNWKGQNQVGYIQKMPNVSFSLLAYASSKDIFRPPFSNFINLYSIYAAILIIGGLIAWFLVKRMAKPIQNLSKVMIGIQKGDLSLRYQMDPWGFEINELGSIFNKMIDNLLAQKHLAEEERVSKETFAKELRLGQQVQRTLLPQTMPKYQGVELSETYIPATQVGGDFYDVFIKKKDRKEQLVLSIADASGKGVRACFYSLSLRNMMRIYAKEHDDIAQAMVAANNLFCKDTGDTGMFVTAIMGVYDYETRVFEYFSCGHNPPIVIRKGGEMEILSHHAIAMGVVLLGSEKKALRVVLNKGDTLVLYTDGITEAHNIRNELYGEKRLMASLEKLRDKGAEEISKGIVDDVNKFVSRAPQHDDITLLIMKVIET